MIFDTTPISREQSIAMSDQDMCASYDTLYMCAS